MTYTAILTATHSLMNFDSKTDFNSLKEALKWSRNRSGAYEILIRAEDGTERTFYTANGRTLYEDGKRVTLKSL